MIRAARAAALSLAFAGATLAGVRADDAVIPAPIVAVPQNAVTHHVIHLGDRTIAYTATAGMLTLRDDHNAPTANIFSVAYTTGDRTRPVTFLYNGGPGSASLWLQIGAFGPRRLAMRTDAPLPAPNAALKDNPATLLDVSDLVFIDPVGTGYSSATGKASDRDFWGVDADIAEFAQFIKRWRSANGRTAGTIYLLGESYGTFRSAGLADALEKDGTPVSGVILLSSLLDYADDFGNTGEANVPDAFAIPSEAAIAWYHKQLPDPPATVQEAVEAATAFTRDVYLPQIMRPQPLDAAARNALAQKLHATIGLDPDALVRANLRVSSTQFQTELLRAQNEIVGRYDGRITAPATRGRRGQSDPSFDPLGGIFGTAFSAYAKNELGWRAAGTYRVLPPAIVNQWDFRRRGFAGRLLAPSVVPDLRDALQRDVTLRVFAASGYFDLATPLYSTEYELANAGLEPSAFARITQAYYASGHMIYLTDAALARLHADLVRFYGEGTAVRQASRPVRSSLSSDLRRPASAGARNEGG